MEKIIKYLEKEIVELDEKCKKLSIHSTEYHFWNGCRCQAKTTLKEIKLSLNS